MSRRTRRTKLEMQAIRDAIYEVVKRDCPMTVRQVFYQLVVMSVFPKVESQYHMVSRLLVKMRWSGWVPWEWIIDNTRSTLCPLTFTSPEEAIRYTAMTYRRDVWADRPAYVEIWVEKDALSGVLYEVTERYAVPLMPGRGYSGAGFLERAAKVIADENKPAYVYNFGDHDPSGLDIARVVEADIRKHAPEAEIHFERIAVTPAQIAEWDLPTEPPKKGDTRTKKFKGETTQLDAIPPAMLRRLVRDCIEQHISPSELRLIEAVERREARYLLNLAKRPHRRVKPVLEKRKRA